MILRPVTEGIFARQSGPLDGPYRRFDALVARLVIEILAAQKTTHFSKAA